jgi:YD repeat-containing protein
VTLTSTYNRFGERAQLDLAQGPETLSHSWTYDALGRLDTATFLGSGTPLDFTPLDDDTLARITRPSGATTDYTYFAQGPVESITVKAGGSTQISRLAYGVDAVQNLTSLAEQHATSDPTGAYGFAGRNLG